MALSDVVRNALAWSAVTAAAVNEPTNQFDDLVDRIEGRLKLVEHPAPTAIYPAQGGAVVLRSGETLTWTFEMS